MKQRTTILSLLLLLLLAACQDDFEQEPGGSGSDTDGMTRIVLRLPDVPHVETRAHDHGNEDSLYEDVSINNVLLLVYKEDGTCVNQAYQQTVEQNNAVNLYLDKNTAKSVYAICNVPDSLLTKWKENNWNAVASVEALKKLSLKIDKPDDAYTGTFMMTGSTSITPNSQSGNLESEYQIEVCRMAARVNFEVHFDPLDENDQFEVSGIFLHNIPLGSNLLQADYPAGADTLDVAVNDYVYASGETDRPRRYFADREKGYRLSTETSIDAKGRTVHTGQFHLFENRQGGIPETAGGEQSGAWKDLAGLLSMKDPNGKYDNLYKKYQQLYKRGLAVGTDKVSAYERQYPKPDGATDKASETGFQYATYLTVEGIYISSGNSEKVKYYIYLGHDNYKDYNIRRNHWYTYTIHINTLNETDVETRVDATTTDKIEVSGAFEDEIFDAHFNTTSALLYCRGNWTVRVAYPDSTPWLEVSKSPAYKPRKVGDPDENKAGFRISGMGGLNYFYIHTDEYVPYISRPNGEEQGQDPGNDSAPDQSTGGWNNVRSGKIICESGTARDTITIRQFSAQMVVLLVKAPSLGVDGNLIHKDLRDTFYVERKLERKNLIWGFNKYWSRTMNNMIGWGVSDGLWNTRNLYKVALQGEPEYDIAPAYPKGLPADVAVGYAVGKNRDRNGNGKIDYEEIVWYLPAINELRALLAAIHGKSSTSYIPEADRGAVWLDEEETAYYASTPSSADPAGITPGLSYYVDLQSEKWGICQRTRQCNVLVARRKNAWKGPQNGETGFEVVLDPSWEEGEEVVMPR